MLMSSELCLHLDLNLKAPLRSPREALSYNPADCVFARMIMRSTASYRAEIPNEPNNSFGFRGSHRFDVSNLTILPGKLPFPARKPVKSDT